MSAKDGLYIMMFSVHGLVRGKDLELGRDADTGGQIKYVIELCEALIDHPEVSRVELVTRQVFDSTVDPVYAEPRETVKPGFDIVRLPCGPKQYLRKEALWPYLDAYVDEVIRYIQSQKTCPEVLHSHYADAGFVAAKVAGLMGVPMIHTGHSLGRVKREKLAEQGLPAARMEEQYAISQRIEAEEIALDNATLVVASTRQEVDEQYSVYHSYQPRRMIVIPPGVDLRRFYSPKRGWYKPNIFANISRFLADARKPMLLAISRPDERKNIRTLIEVFGESDELKQRANLVVVAGNRDDIRDMEDGPRRVLSDILHLIDRYDLYGHIAYPKHHDAEDVPHLYRLAAKSGGVFINPALTEPFGLTLLEAAASGLPIVATEDGGPRDIIAYCKNGTLIDPLDKKEMTEALLSLLRDRAAWRRCAHSGVTGVNRHFSWPGHVNKYVRELKQSQKKSGRKPVARLVFPKTPKFERLIITDIDNTLVGDAKGLDALKARLKLADDTVGFGVSTGRRLDSTLEVLEQWKVPAPQVLITSVGTEINYGPDLAEDKEWASFIAYRWHSDEIRRVLREIPGLKLQAKIDQRRFKISYNVDPEIMPQVPEILRHLRIRDLHANVVYSHNAYLDILPVRASKGGALRYLSFKWGVPPQKMLVAGDSGNDAEMLRGATCGVVVGNHSPELEVLRGAERVYFAKRDFAGGIVEGIDHFEFLAKSPSTHARAKAS